jgi:hypothetical protein
MTLLVIIVVLLVVGAIAASMGAFDGPRRRRVVREVPVETTRVVPTRTVTTERTVVSDDTQTL